jgi:glucose/arabinose dehydrogenase
MRRFTVVLAAATSMVVTAATWSPAQTAAPHPASGVAAPRTALGAAAPGRVTALGRKTIVSGIDNPAAFTFLPDGRIVYGERDTGNIQLYDPATKKTKLLFTVPDVTSNGEQGLLGLAVDPSWPSHANVFAYATRNLSGSLKNEILKIKVVNDKGVSFKVIFKSNTTPGTYHDGGHIAFGPGGKLYAVVGESHNESNAQNLNSNAGKVLRMTKSGGAPKDNPFRNSLVFTYGLRNSFGFTFDPQTKLMWETENGPECNDEINLEQAGENHAWGPHETCSGTAPQNTNQDGPQPRIMPLAWYVNTIAPTGAVFCDGCGLTGAGGDLFFGAFNTGQIRQVELTGNRKGIASQTVAYSNAGGILSMERGPSGGIYFSTTTAIYKLVQL